MRGYRLRGVELHRRRRRISRSEIPFSDGLCEVDFRGTGLCVPRADNRQIFERFASIATAIFVDHLLWRQNSCQKAAQQTSKINVSAVEHITLVPAQNPITQPET